MVGGGARPPQHLHHMLGGGWSVSRSTPPSLEAMSACSDELLDKLDMKEVHLRDVLPTSGAVGNSMHLHMNPPPCLDCTQHNVVQSKLNLLCSGTRTPFLYLNSLPLLQLP